MGFRPPNYHQQRGDRDRAKERKKQERLERREQDARERKAERERLLGQSPAAPASEPSSEND
jgi:hypothetical protein